jgi:hypothetical protein
MAGVVAKKLGIKEGVRAFLVNAPTEAVKAIDPPPLTVAAELTGDFDYIHFFTTSQSEFDEVFPKLKAHLSPAGMLWVSWPKNRQLDTDLTIKKVIELGYNHGLVESKTVGINTMWSALKFTHPKEGKTYKNSYGRLQADAP